MTARVPIVALSLVVILAPAFAQTDDLEEQDRRYLERIRAQREAPPPPPSSDPEQAREAMLARFLERADELIRDKNYRSASSDSYVVKSDDPRLDATSTADLLETFRTWFDGFWPDRIELLDYGGPSRMYLFWSYYKYNQLFTGKERFDEFKTSGHYRGFLDTVVVHTDGTSPPDLADTLVHEAAHQLVVQRLTGEGVPAPSWLDEGLADYFGFTAQGKDGRFRAGEIGAKIDSPFRDGASGRPSNARGRLEAMKERMSRDPLWTIGTLLDANEAEFYGGEIRANYGASWILVHYLMHGDDGAHADAFVDWIRDDVRGSTGRGLDGAIGLDRSTLHERFTRHARRIKVR